MLSRIIGPVLILGILSWIFFAFQEPIFYFLTSFSSLFIRIILIAILSIGWFGLALGLIFWFKIFDKKLFLKIINFKNPG
jgi:hypothetical protein